MLFRAFATLPLLLSLAACSSSEDPPSVACVEVNLDCKPLVSPPTFEAVYTNILKPTCAAGNGPCHNAGAGGLDMATIDVAFSSLASRVDPSNVGCSTLAKRLETKDSAYRMPPGATLSEPQLCAVRQWMANGAAR